ncbi:MAG: hypothetical protein GX352_01050 [Clostridiales bacterium]|nr:hypothetical protein [Clostridiales bacterium]
MKIFLTLLKTNLNVFFGISALKYRFTKSKKRLWEPILVAFSILVGGGSILTMYVFLLLGLFIGGQSIGSPELVLTFSFMATQLIILIFGIFYVMSAFYFSNDMNILIPLPLKPRTILGVKFTTILISEYLIALPMLLPALIIYGLGSQMSALYWLKGFILILTAPVLPLIISAIFVIILMRFANIRRSKDLIVVIGSLFGVAAGIGINLITQSLPQGNEGEFIKGLVQNNSQLIQSIGRKFPPSLWATLGLSQHGLQGWAYFLLFVIVSLGLVVVFLWLSNRFFYKSYLAGQETRKKTKILSNEEMVRNAGKISSPVVSLFKREWRLYMRTPIYVVNGLVGMIMIPFFLVMPFFTKSGEMDEVLTFIKNPDNALIFVFIVLGIMIFGSSMNMISCTSLSREGNTFWISKMIPAPPGKQILSKLLHSNILSLAGQIIIAITAFFVWDIAIYRLIIIILIGGLANNLINILDLMVDVLRPKMEWNNPQEAIKQNLNVLFGVLISFFVIGLLGIITILMILANITEFWIYGALTSILVLLSIPSLYGLYALAGKKYSSIEV